MTTRKWLHELGEKHLGKSETAHIKSQRVLAERLALLFFMFPEEAGLGEAEYVRDTLCQIRREQT